MPWQRRVAVLTPLVLLLGSCSLGGADMESVQKSEGAALPRNRSARFASPVSSRARGFLRPPQAK